MARPEVTGCKPRSTPVSAHPELDTVEIKKAQLTSEPPFQPVYTIEEFCKAHRISVSFYYKARAEPEKYGNMPEEMRVGTRVLISYEAAARWRAEREAATAAEAAAESAPKPKRVSKKATASASFVQE